MGSIAEPSAIGLSDVRRHFGFPLGLGFLRCSSCLAAPKCFPTFSPLASQAWPSIFIFQKPSSPCPCSVHSFYRPVPKTTDRCMPARGKPRLQHSGTTRPPFHVAPQAVKICQDTIHFPDGRLASNTPTASGLGVAVCARTKVCEGASDDLELAVPTLRGKTQWSGRVSRVPIHLSALFSICDFRVGDYAIDTICGATDGRPVSKQ